MDVKLNRDKYIGGSDLPYILGLAEKYESIYEFAKHKLFGSDFEGNEYTYYGKYMEDKIRNYINEKYNADYKPGCKINGIYRANVDGFDTKQGLIEIKTFGKELDIDYYTPQCMFYMYNYNVDKILLIGYKRPNDFFKPSYTFNYDEDRFNLEFDPNNIEEHVIEFDKNKWENYEIHINNFKNALDWLKNNPNSNEKDFLDKLYPKELTSLINEIKPIEIELYKLKLFEDKAKTFRSKLYDEMEKYNISSITFDGLRVSKKQASTRKTKTIDEKLFKDYPEIYNKYIKIKESVVKGSVLIKLKEIN